MSTDIKLNRLDTFKLSYPKLIDRLDMSIRLFSATVGSYCFACLATFLMAISLPLDRAAALYTAEMIGFLLIPCGTMWSFYALTGIKAFIRLLALSVIIYLIIYLAEGSFPGLIKMGFI